jgi:hypothetical protein
LARRKRKKELRAKTPSQSAAAESQTERTTISLRLPTAGRSLHPVCQQAGFARRKKIPAILRDRQLDYLKANTHL